MNTPWSKIDPQIWIFLIVVGVLLTLGGLVPLLMKVVFYFAKAIPIESDPYQDVFLVVGALWVGLANFGFSSARNARTSLSE